MAAEEQGQERTEQATEKRRLDFRKKGQVAQSREVQTAAMMTGFVLLWHFYMSTFWQGLSRLLVEIWSAAAGFVLSPVSTVNLFNVLIGRVFLLLAPVLLMVMVIGVLSSFLQFGWLFTTKPMAPDLSKMDPIKGMQRFFSLRSLVELLKSLAKIILVGWVAYRTVKPELESAVLLINMDVVEILIFLGRVSGLVLLKSCGVLILLAGIDFLFVRWEMEKKMKMTKQEQKEESRETDGDPFLKARIRSQQLQMARSRMMNEVPKADVIITNPTHLSVAIVYKRDLMDAPRVVAKGADLVAMRIREVARENGVPLLENIPVARALFKVDLGGVVPEELFLAVAEIMAYVYNLKGIKQ